MHLISIRIFLALIILVIFCSSPLLAATEQRTALVIGNSAYETGPLRNPANDAADMAQALKELGFNVVLKKNVRHQEMEEAIEDFGKKLRRGGVGLFYFAGHGVQVGGVNYLMPIGTKINKESDVKHRAVSAEKILDEMAYANNGLNIVILDACRDNPFARSMRSTSRGLAIISSAPEGTFISYATGAGQTAQDGDGRNSPYTAALLKNIKKPGLPIERVFKQVRVELSRQKQTPWELSSLKGEFYFRPGKHATASDMEEAEPQQKDYAMARPPAREPADEKITDSATGMQFVFVKGGCYQMGDTFGDGQANEKPVHEVCVNDFYIGKYEVTQGQWKKVMGYNASYFSSCGENCPVESVSWNDTQEFIRKLNSQSGKTYRLPTEAEWEYAARSGGKSEKYAGGNDVDPVAWYVDNSGRKTHPVGQKRPNGLGLYDMSGNVWEWCSDWHGEKYYSQSSRDNPGGPSSGSWRVLRGGSCSGSSDYARAADRFFIGPEFRYYYNGFRLAMAPRPSVSTAQEIRRDGRFIANSNGTVLDTSTNLMWAAKDNGEGINWANAKSYCENYRGGGYSDWRMPTQDEMAGLYDNSKKRRTACGFDAGITELLNLTCSWVWASETRGSEAANFGFTDGNRPWNHQSVVTYLRALPVRSVK